MYSSHWNYCVAGLLLISYALISCLISWQSQVRNYVLSRYICSALKNDWWISVYSIKQERSIEFRHYCSDGICFTLFNIGAYRVWTWWISFVKIYFVQFRHCSVCNWIVDQVGDHNVFKLPWSYLFVLFLDWSAMAVD